MATWPGARQYNMDLKTNMDPASLWITSNTIDYCDPKDIPRPNEADVALMRDCNRPRRHRTHMARDAAHMLKPELIGRTNNALLPPAGAARGVGCAPRVTAAGNGVAEIGWPFGIPFVDQNMQKQVGPHTHRLTLLTIWLLHLGSRCGTLLCGQNKPKPDWHSGEPIRPSLPPTVANPNPKILVRQNKAHCRLSRKRMRRVDAEERPREIRGRW